MNKRKPSPKPAKAPIVGQVVHYHLSAANVETLTNRKPTSATEGEVVALTVTSAGSTEGTVNGHVLHHGDDALWVTDVPYGDGPGTWLWPPKS